jgi:hypothetical protein
MPTETDPTEDYISAKGVAFEGLDDTRVYGEAGTMMFQDDEITTPVTLEELRHGEGTAVGRLFDRRTFSNGIASNKWLTQFFTSTATDTVPLHITFDYELYGVTFGNKNTDVYCDVEIYKNGTDPGDLVFTMEVRGFQFYHDTTVTNHFNGSLGDNISVYIKQVSGGDNAADVFVDLFFRITSNTVGQGGQ